MLQILESSNCFKIYLTQKGLTELRKLKTFDLTKEILILLKTYSFKAATLVVNKFNKIQRVGEGKEGS